MEKKEETQVVLEGLDETNISSLLEKYKEVSEILSQLNNTKEMIRNKIKVYLKEREWDKYVDDRTKMSVSLTTSKRQTIDKTQLEIMLTKSQMAQVIKISTYEKLMILTPEAKERLKKYVK